MLRRLCGTCLEFEIGVGGSSKVGQIVDFSRPERKGEREVTVEKILRGGGIEKCCQPASAEISTTTGDHTGGICWFTRGTQGSFTCRRRCSCYRGGYRLSSFPLPLKKKIRSYGQNRTRKRSLTKGYSLSFELLKPSRVESRTNHSREFFFIGCLNWALG